MRQLIVLSSVGDEVQITQPFDPDYLWLGIPPGEQLPDHYRLLGINRFENNPEVISNTYEQRVRHVRTFQLGEHATQSQKLLSELAAARSCLMDSSRKAIYDEQFASPLSELNPPPVASTIPAATATAQRQRRRPSRSPLVEVAKIVVGGLAGLTIGVLLLWYAFGMDVLGVMESDDGHPGTPLAQHDTDEQAERPRQDAKGLAGAQEAMLPEPDVVSEQVAEPRITQSEDSVSSISTPEESTESNESATAQLIQ